MYILGLNAYHGDSAAALIEDGIVIAAVEEERFTRIKHWAGLPAQSIQYCLNSASIQFTDLDAVAINSDNSAHRLKKLQYMIRSRPGLKLLLEKLVARSRRRNVLQEIQHHTGFHTDKVPLHAIEHHTAHLASAFYPSGFERAAVLSVDGFGDFSSTAWGVGEDSSLEVLGYQHFPHSLGIFYQAITQYLGFPNYGDEYKVMGLASYGRPNQVGQLEQLLELDAEGRFHLGLEFFRHHSESVSYTWQAGAPVFGSLYSENLVDLLGPARNPDEPITQFHKDIAASAQQLYEHALLNLLQMLSRLTDCENLALAGGCAMNSVANGRIKQQTGFSRIYVQPAAGDAGGAIGAALVVNHKNMPDCTRRPMTHAYLGPAFCDSDIRQVLDRNASSLSTEYFKIVLRQESDLLEYVAGQLDQGAVVGWFQGAMEWGARALGNRSILADPRNPDIQALLNRKIKRRESFRPFAPSILIEHTGDWFEINDEVPFMEKVYPIRAERQPLIPAVTHVDGTGRLQTVSQADNPRYYGLIDAFFNRTGIPLLLNTSFNENEPVVCSPEQALDCFLRTNMDVLVMENYSITRIAER